VFIYLFKLKKLRSLAALILPFYVTHGGLFHLMTTLWSISDPSRFIALCWAGYPVDIRLIWFMW